mmetsp:Transcript_28446/g.67725  ORF Transcript_28446/g.67725 Transcript_28446/m.67725 type:complete len:228 (+) Transcript_28446:229-912(+)
MLTARRRVAWTVATSMSDRNCIASWSLFAVQTWMPDCTTKTRSVTTASSTGPSPMRSSIARASAVMLAADSMLWNSAPAITRLALFIALKTKPWSTTATLSKLESIAAAAFSTEETASVYSAPHVLFSFATPTPDLISLPMTATWSKSASGFLVRRIWSISAMYTAHSSRYSWHSAWSRRRRPPPLPPVSSLSPSDLQTFFPRLALTHRSPTTTSVLGASKLPESAI